MHLACHRLSDIRAEWLSPTKGVSNPLHLVLPSAALLVLIMSIFDHLLILSSDLFVCLPLHLFFSSPERKAPGELIVQAGSVVRPSVVRRPSTISNDFSSKTTRPIASKFHIQPSGPLEKKSYSNGLGHMTNMAAMPIYGKNIKKSSSAGPIDR